MEVASCPIDGTHWSMYIGHQIANDQWSIWKHFNKTQCLTASYHSLYRHIMTMPCWHPSRNYKENNAYLMYSISLKHKDTQDLWPYRVFWSKHGQRHIVFRSTQAPQDTKLHPQRDQRAYKQKITKHIRILTLTHTHWIGWQGVERTARREGCRQCDGWGDR